MKKNLIWLASYPKSGNTWFRAFLSALRSKPIETPDMNALDRTPMASSRILFEQLTGLDSSDLTPDETARLRPDVYRIFSESREDWVPMKVHDAFTQTASGEWMFPPEATRGVIYLVRNPLDVAISFASHRAASETRTVHDLCDSRFCLSPGNRGLPGQLRQLLLSWSEHVRSWLNSPNRVCLMRYEDMKSDPLATFKRAASFLELDKSDAEIQTAIEHCEFSKLQSQEAGNRLKAKPQSCTAFFRKGQVGEWRERLEPRLIAQLVEHHREVMQDLGYLDKNNARFIPPLT